MSLLDKNTKKMRTMYYLLYNIFSDTEVFKYLDKIKSAKDLTEQLVKMIFEREINEASSRDEDLVFGGLMEFLSYVLVRFP